MILKNSKWLTHAQDLKDQSVQNNDQITDNMVHSVKMDSINDTGVYTNDMIDSDNHAVQGLTNKANLAPLYYPNLFYNSTFSNNKAGWSTNNGLDGYSSEGYPLIKIPVSSAIDQYESYLPSYQGTYHAWYNYYFYHKYGSVSPKFAFRVGIKYTKSNQGFMRGSVWSNYGFGNSFYIFKDSRSDWITSGNFATNAVESALFYTDKPNVINGKTVSDPTKQVPFDEFYTPWGVIQPDKPFNQFTCFFPDQDNNSNPLSGAFDLFNPQLILVNNDMTREQLNKLDIRVLPTYDTNFTVGFDPVGNKFN